MKSNRQLIEPLLTKPALTEPPLTEPRLIESPLTEPALVEPPLIDHQLIDHHCHGVIRRDLDRTGFELLLSDEITELAPPTPEEIVIYRELRDGPAAGVADVAQPDRVAAAEPA